MKKDNCGCPERRAAAGTRGLLRAACAALALMMPAWVFADGLSSSVDTIASFVFNDSTMRKTSTGNSTDNPTDVTASGCTVTWQSIAYTGSSNVETIVNGSDTAYYYKFTANSSFITIALSDGSPFEAGDTVTIDICSNSTSTKTVGLYVRSEYIDSIVVDGVTSTASTTADYVLQENDINDDGSLTFYRWSSSGTGGNLRLHGISVRRQYVPALTARARNAEVAVGSSAILIASLENVEGATDISYQWYNSADTTSANRSQYAVSGATDSIYMTSALEAQTYYYYCVASFNFEDAANSTDTGGTYTLTGDNNSWSEKAGDDYTFTYEGNGVYTLTLSSLSGTFKIITNNSWESTAYGSSYSNSTGYLSLNTEYTLTVGTKSSEVGNLGITSGTTLTGVTLTLTITDNGATLLIQNTADVTEEASAKAYELVSDVVAVEGVTLFSPAISEFTDDTLEVSLGNVTAWSEKTTINTNADGSITVTYNDQWTGIQTWFDNSEDWSAYKYFVVEWESSSAETTSSSADTDGTSGDTDGLSIGLNPSVYYVSYNDTLTCSLNNYPTTGVSAVEIDTVDATNVIMFTIMNDSVTGTVTIKRAYLAGKYTAYDDSLYAIDLTVSDSTEAYITCKTTAATIYYSLSDEAYADYETTSAYTATWKKYTTGTAIDATIGDYLTVVSVLYENTDSAQTKTAYAHYIADFSNGQIRLNTDSALTSIALTNTAGSDLNVRVLYYYEVSETDDNGKVTQIDKTMDVTDYCSLSYASEDTGIATITDGGIVKGVTVGTVYMIAYLLEAGNYEVTAGDSVRQTVNVTAKLTAIITLVESDDEYTLESTSYTFEDDATYATVTISLPDELKASSDDYAIFYTLDGSTPTWQSTLYDGSTLTLGVTTYLYVIIYKKTTNDDGTVTYSDPQSIAQASFHLPSTISCHLDDEYQLAAGEVINIEDEDSGETYVVATFGSPGDTNDGDSVWHETYQDVNMLSSEIGTYYYFAMGLKDATNEPATLYKSDASAVYQGNSSDNFNIFYAPINGAYIRFEPQQDGEINVIIRQNGIITDDDNPDYTSMSRRRVFVCDETGKPIDNLRAMINPNALLNGKTTDIYHFGYEEITSNDNLEFYQMLVYSRYITLQGQSTSIEPSNSNTWTNDTLLLAKKFWYGTTDGDTLKYNSDGTYSNQAETCAADEMPYNILYKDGNGYIVMSKCYVRYSFPVEAGRTYFIMGQGTKIGPCGYSFHPRTVTSETATVSDETDGSDNTDNIDLTIDATTYGNDASDVKLDAPTSTGQITAQLTRTFDADVWTSLVLPFSVSPSMVEDVFGEGTDIIHYNGVSNDTLELMKHYHQLIVAGTPVFIRPAQTVENPVFDAVTYGTYTYQVNDDATWAVDSVSSTCADVETVKSGDWTLKGSYTPTTTAANVYLLAYKSSSSTDGESSETTTTATDNSFYYFENAQDLPGTRAWLEYSGTETSNVPLLTTLSLNGVTETVDSETTGIVNAVLGTDGTGTRPADNRIYSVSGQLVRNAADGTDGLPKGIYILNGKKFVVK